MSIPYQSKLAAPSQASLTMTQKWEVTMLCCQLAVFESLLKAWLPIDRKDDLAGMIDATSYIELEQVF